MIQFILFLLVVAIGNILIERQQIKEYNDGICNECNVQFLIDEIVNYSDGSWQQYVICPRCNKKIVKPICLIE